MSDDYLDFRPIGKRQGRFHFTQPVRISSTSSRRPHVRAYLEFMYPDLGPTLAGRWKNATREICKTYYLKEAEKVAAPLFDFLVDREVWETYFADIKSKMERESRIKTPQWPFRITPELTRNGHPLSREYSEFRNRLMRTKREIAKRESWIWDFNADPDHSSEPSVSVPQAPLPALNPRASVSSNDATASVLQASSSAPREINTKTLTTAMPPDLSEHQQRLWFWNLAGGNSIFLRHPIIGPFEMKLPPHVSFNTSVTGPDLQHLKAIKTALLPRGCSLNAQISTTDDKDDELLVVLTLGFAKGYGGKLCDRVEMLRFWGCMTEWLSKVYDEAALSLHDHLLDSLVSRNGNISNVSQGLEDLYAKDREFCRK